MKCSQSKSKHQQEEVREKETEREREFGTTEKEEMQAHLECQIENASVCVYGIFNTLVFILT